MGGEQQQAKKKKSNQNNHHKKKNDVDSLDPILKEFSVDLRFDPTGSQGVIFFVMGLLTTAAIIYLHTTPLLSVTSPTKDVIFPTVLLTAVSLATTYIEISRKKHLQLISSREIPTSEYEKEDFNGDIITESAMYSLFTVNTAYLLGALTFAFYILPTYGLGENIACGVATLVPALLLLAAAKFGLVF